jgi:hypothetical protein
MYFLSLMFTTSPIQLTFLWDHPNIQWGVQLTSSSLCNFVASCVQDYSWYLVANTIFLCSLIVTDLVSHSYILDLCTCSRWVVSFMPFLLYPRGKGPQYSLDRRLGGPQNQSGWYGEVNILDPTGIPNFSVVQLIASLYINYATADHHTHNKRKSSSFVYFNLCAFRQ